MGKYSNYQGLITLVCLSIVLIVLFFLHLWCIPSLPAQPFSLSEGAKNHMWQIMIHTLSWVTAGGFFISWIIYALRYHVIAILIAVIPLIQWIYFFYLYLSY